MRRPRRPRRQPGMTDALVLPGRIPRSSGMGDGEVLSILPLFGLKESKCGVHFVWVYVLEYERAERLRLLQGMGEI